MICFECSNELETGDRYNAYTYRGLEVYIHTIGCEGALIDRAQKKMEQFKAKLDAIEKQCLEETPEETDQYLRDAGYDPDELVARMRKRLHKALDESPMNPKNKKDEQS